MVLVRERRPDRARRAALVAVVEVIDVVVVEVDGLLDQPNTEHIETEVQVTLCVIDCRGDVMQTKNRVDHPPILHKQSAAPAPATHRTAGGGDRSVCTE